MINDFGEKIGGARKDVWKERGLMIEDLDGMTQGEKAQRPQTPSSGRIPHPGPGSSNSVGGG